MCEKRKELLLKLKEYVESKKNIKFEYCSTNDTGEKCFCSIGYLLNELGFDFDSKEFEPHNHEYIELISPHFDFKGIEEVFSIDELKRIQTFNDNGNREMLLAYIDLLIKEGAV